MMSPSYKSAYCTECQNCLLLVNTLVQQKKYFFYSRILTQLELSFMTPLLGDYMNNTLILQPVNISLRVPYVSLDTSFHPCNSETKVVGSLYGLINECCLYPESNLCLVKVEPQIACIQRTLSSRSESLGELKA